MGIPSCSSLSQTRPVHFQLATWIGLGASDGLAVQSHDAGVLLTNLRNEDER